MNANDIISSCNSLIGLWPGRQSQFEEWYSYILMEDKLYQRGMESFVSNEPVTFFNLALHLLSVAICPKIPYTKTLPDDMLDIKNIEDFLSSRIDDLEKLSMRRGRGGFIRELAGLLICTGWYSVFSIVTDTEIICEVWNPAEVFPEFSEDGLISCAHIYSISGRAAKRKAFLKGWKLTSTYQDTQSVTVYDYWTVDGKDIINAIVIGNDLVKSPSVERLPRIPIFTSPVAGLPDRGAINKDWQKQAGRSIIATNINIYDSINKLFTFLMQLIRDTAQSRWIEKSAGEGRVKPEDLFKRGALFHLGLNESLESLPTNPIPVELRTMLFDVGTQRQKGSLPDVMWGNVAQEISSYAMQQISSSAMSILSPYQLAMKFLFEELFNYWLSEMREFNLHPYDFKVPKKDLPPVEADLRVDIPGDIVQRATVARMLNPEFALSIPTVTDILFPEILDPLAEQARVNKDKAMHHPLMIQLNLYEALKQREKMLLASGDAKTASVYGQFADVILRGGANERQ